MGTNFYWLEKPPCPTCGHEPERLHIGKSSAGWVFALRSHSDLQIHDLSDWVERFYLSPHIVDEYGRAVTPGEMLTTIMLRGRDAAPVDFDWTRNYAQPGPRNLIRARADNG